MKIVGYYVTLGASPCSFRNVSGSYRAGILVPVTDPAAKDHKGLAAPVAFFDKRRDARRAIRRSNESAIALRMPHSLVEEWARQHVPSYFSGSQFEIQPLAKQ